MARCLRWRLRLDGVILDEQKDHRQVEKAIEHVVVLGDKDRSVDDKGQVNLDRTARR